MTLAEMIELAATKQALIKHLEVAVQRAIKVEHVKQFKKRRVMVPKNKGCTGKLCENCSGCNRRDYLKDYMYDPGFEQVAPLMFIDKYLGVDFKYLGKGHFAHVYLHEPSGLVVKITGFNAGGVDTYPSYARFCMENKDKLKHLPEIMHIQEYDTAYFCIMKQYVPSDSSIMGFAERYAMQDLIQGRTTNYKNIPEHRRESIIQTCMAVAELSKFAKVDLHADNLMQDEHGEPVLTDPFSYVIENTTAHSASYNNTTENTCS